MGTGSSSCVAFEGSWDSCLTSVVFTVVGQMSSSDPEHESAPGTMDEFREPSESDVGYAVPISSFGQRSEVQGFSQPSTLPFISNEM